MKTIKRKDYEKRKPNYSLCLMLVGMIILGTVFTACEGPAGTDGQQGPQGEVGPIGPAGEDGSTMWAGPNEPTADVGKEGDYYLNSSTGEFYGPKDTGGWGNPIMVLMGEDGKDGTDGEDGSRIYSGTTVPEASLGNGGDYYLNKSTYDLYGPKTESGWGTPVNIKGAKGTDGNANVTRYIFPGHDFSNTYLDLIVIASVTKIEMLESSWLFYLVRNSNGGNTDEFFYPVPGSGGLTSAISYDVRFFYRNDPGHAEFQIFVIGDISSARAFDRIEIVRIEASNTEDLRKLRSGGAIIPDHLDTSDYEAVAGHYGFGNSTPISKQ